MLDINNRRGFFRKYLLPKTIYGRMIWLIAIPLLIMQVLTFLSFSVRHHLHTTQILSQNIISELNLFVGEVEANPNNAQKISNKLGLNYQITELPKNIVENYNDSEGKIFLSEYNRVTPTNLINYSPYIRFNKNTEQISIYLVSNEKTFKFTMHEYRLYTTVTSKIVWFMSIVGGILVFLWALFIARNQAIPIRRLAKSIIKFSRGDNEAIQKLEVRGSDEVRQAIYNFKIMAGRLTRHNRQRTNMLSGISHDLRTPLTRMKLLLAMAEKNQTNTDLNENIKDMETMIESYLDFTKGIKTDKNEKISIGDLLNKVTDKWKKTGKNIDLDLINDGYLKINPDNITRAFDNIISNSFKYGDTVNIVASDYDKEHTAIQIIDNGTGIPDDKLEEVFNPFFRVDESRNQEISGVGLGLSVAFDITTHYGGDIVLKNREGTNGLIATIILPKII